MAGEYEAMYRDMAGQPELAELDIDLAAMRQADFAA